LPAQPIADRSARRRGARRRAVAAVDDWRVVHQSAPLRTGIWGRAALWPPVFCVCTCTKRTSCRPLFCVQRAAGSTLRWSTRRSLARRRRSPRLRSLFVAAPRAGRLRLMGLKATKKSWTPPVSGHVLQRDAVGRKALEEARASFALAVRGRAGETCLTVVSPSREPAPNLRPRTHACVGDT